MSNSLKTRCPRMRLAKPSLSLPAPPAALSSTTFWINATAVFVVACRARYPSSDAQEARTPVFGDTSPMRRIAAACNGLAGSTSSACNRQASSIASLIARLRRTSSAAAATSVAELLEPPCGSENPPLERYHALSEHLRLAHSIVDIFDDIRARVDGTEFRSMPLASS